MPALDIVATVLFAYLGLGALWFAGVMLLDQLYFKSGKEASGDAGFAVLALALIPLFPVLWLIGALDKALRKVSR